MFECPQVLIAATRQYPSTYVYLIWYSVMRSFNGVRTGPPAMDFSALRSLHCHRGGEVVVESWMYVSVDKCTQARCHGLHSDGVPNVACRGALSLVDVYSTRSSTGRSFRRPLRLAVLATLTAGENWIPRGNAAQLCGTITACADISASLNCGGTARRSAARHGVWWVGGSPGRSVGRAVVACQSSAETTPMQLQPPPVVDRELPLPLQPYCVVSHSIGPVTREIAHLFCTSWYAVIHHRKQFSFRRAHTRCYASQHIASPDGLLYLRGDIDFRSATTVSAPSTARRRRPSGSSILVFSHRSKYRPTSVRTIETDGYEADYSIGYTDLEAFL